MKGETEMKKIYTFIFALISLFTLSLPAFADGSNDRITNDNVYTKKTVQDNNNGTYTITLENYLEGEGEVIVNPLDFVLLMDMSSSMSNDKNKIGGKTRLELLKTAACEFVESLCNNDNLPTNYGQYHKLSLIGFSKTGGNIYYDGGAMVDVKSTNVENIKTWINDLTTTQGTRSDEGMKAAYDALAELSADGRPKVVIFFTDGCPSTVDGTAFTSDYAQAAVNIAYAMKQPLGSINYTVTIPTATDSYTGEQYFSGTQYTLTKGLGATIYSVAILSDETSGGNLHDEGIELDIRRFLNYVSSNYNFNIKSSSSDFDSNYFFGENYGSNGGDEEPGGYYSLATSGTQLTEIFINIAEETIGKAKLEMAESAVVLDALTDGFILPEDMEAEDIKLYTCDVVTGNTSDTVQWEQENGKDKWVEFKPWEIAGDMEDYIFINGGPVSVPSDDGYIQVTGFNFSENFVGPVRKKSNGQILNWHGKKLIVQFDIEVSPSNPGGLSQCTNNSESGIYVKEGTDGYSPVEEYERPTVDLPYIRILKDGLEVGESAIFHVVKVDENGNVDQTVPYEATVIISNDGEEGIIPNAILKLVCTGYYRIEEMTDWTWAYDPTQEETTPNPEVQTVYVHTVPAPEDGDNVPLFADASYGSELNDQGSAVDHGEAYVLNYMSAGSKETKTSTPGKGVE